LTLRIYQAFEYFHDKDMQDIVVGIQKHQIPEEADQSFIYKGIVFFLESEDEEIENGVNGFVAFADSLLVLIYDEACAFGDVADHFGLTF
jgi:hypothetical protein